MARYIFCFSLLCLISFLGIAQKNSSIISSLENYCQCEQVFINPDSSTENAGSLKVLKTGHQMALIDMSIIKGSCWDYVNEVYKQSGVSEAKENIFRSSKKGPFARSNIVQPGDWIYHINHQFNNIEHSAIFICWKNFANRIAITLSYAGMNKNKPGHFGEYKLDNIYSIFRPKMNFK
jgi:hypothetical protein